MPAVIRLHQSPDDPVRMFATCTPGLAPILAHQLSTVDKVKLLWQGHDGRADVVSFTGPARLAATLPTTVRTIDDLFLQIGHARRCEGDRAHWLAQRLCRTSRLLAASTIAGRSIASGTYRVIARVLSERSFLRADLRRCAEAHISHHHPASRLADPASNEIWLCEYLPGNFVSGLRMTRPDHRQRGGRQVQRPAALRPGVAAAMVHLAGPAAGVLLDPCCGTGTVLAEAAAVGWQARGIDADPYALTAAMANVPNADVRHGDARRLPFADASVGAWVSNVPFGQTHQLPGDSLTWLALVLTEAARVVQTEGRIVVLTANAPTHAPPPAGLIRLRMYRIRVLGRPAVIDVFTTV